MPDTFPDIHFGPEDEDDEDDDYLDEDDDDTDDDDDELEETPEDVTALLGFDPLDLDKD